MSRELVLPVEEFGQFISAAGKWLGQTSDAKQAKLELRVGQHEGKLHLSVGGDSCFMECLLNVNAEAIQEPFWLDLHYLMKFDFKVASLVLIIPPQTSKAEESRAQFKSPGINFRIPLRTGTTWNRNAENIGVASKGAPGLELTAEFFNQIFGWLKLPNSFKINQRPCVTMESSKVGQLSTYEYDMGAFLNEFSHPSIEYIGTFQRAVFSYHFLTPYQEIETLAQKLEIQQTERQSFGKIVFKEGTQFLKFRWSEPNSTKSKDSIPASVEDARKAIEACLVFDPKEFLKNVVQVLSFHSDKELEEDAIQFSILKGLKQYTLDNRKAASILVNGEVLEPAYETLRVVVQGKCLRDYLKLLSLDAPVGLEVCRSSIILYQQDPKKGISLLYWAPVNSR